MILKLPPVRAGLFTAAAILLLSPMAMADPVISEFVASNQSGLQDEDNTRQDWIEIHNPAAAPQNMDGWYLTDNAGNLTKWRFPAAVIEPGGFLLVWASNKDRRIAGAPLHTNFSLNSDGEYLALVRPGGTTVQQEFAPEFPNQDPDRGYGLIFTRSTLLVEGSNADYRVPAAAGELAANWHSAAATPAGWTLAKPTGLGFGLTVPGMMMTIRSKNTATGLLNTQADAETLLSRPAGHVDILNESVGVQQVFNVLGNGGDGHFGNNTPVPLWAVEDYVVRCTGLISITPAQAGPWTFGINSDDGGKVKIDGAAVMNDPTQHGPADHFGTVTLTAGQHTIEAYFWERGGGDEGELFAAPGALAAWSAAFRLVGDTATGGLPVFTPPSGSGGGTGAIRTNIESTMRNVNASAFLRTAFNGGNTAGITSLGLTMRYNDGMVAYLNGTEVARSNAPAAPAWNSAATGSRSNDDSLAPVTFNITQAMASLNSGTNLLAIHGLNQTTADDTFLLLPEVTAASLPAVPSYAFFNTPTPGGINSAASSLGKVADTVFAPRRGFYPDAVVTTVPFPVTLSTTTPGATIRYTTDGSTPTETIGNLYSGPINITQTTALRAAAFKTGWEPTNVDTHTYLILNDVLTQSAAGAAPGPGWPAAGSLNGQSINYGMDPDIVNSADTVIGGAAQVKAALMAIPTICLTSDLPNFFNPSTGIYVNPGARGLNWERRCAIEMMNDPIGGGFAVNAGMRIRGGYSRSGGNPKHAFHLYFRDDYGVGKLNYPFFGHEGTDTFNQIDFRTAQNYSWSFGGDGNNTFLREEFCRQAQLEMGWPGSRTRYFHLYINGQYWGLFNTDERTEADHCSTYLGGDKLNWDVVKTEQDQGYITGVTDGYLDAWHALFAKANPLTSPGVYTRRTLTLADYYDMQGRAPDGVTPNGSPVLLDVDALIDYMLLTFWTGNLDGATSAFLGNQTANNWFGARDRTGAAGFIYFAHDFEHSLFNTGEDRTGPFNRTFSDVTTYGTKRTNYNPMFLHADLLDVPAYKWRWYDRVQKHFYNGGALSQSANLARINEFAAIVDTAIIAESARWGDAQSATPLTRRNWQGARDYILNSYIPARTAVVLSQLRADGLYPVMGGINFTPPGGYTTSTAPLLLNGPTSAGATWYYMTDGSDPRRSDGTLHPGALVYTPGGTVFTTLMDNGVAGPGATWKYRDPSIDLGASDIVVGHAAYDAANWKHPAFDDSNATIWKSGDAELGAGDSSDGRLERTQINIGATGARFQVLYFRKQFNVTNPAQYEALELEALIDDGAIFYLNGREVARLNMPGGTATYAYTNLGAVNEAAFVPVTDARLVPAALNDGLNTFCVQVHQTNATSSDLSFDLRLRARKTQFANPVLLPPGVVTVNARAFDGAQWSAVSTATFFVDAEPASAANLAVSEIHYHPALQPGDAAAGYNDDTFFEYVELLNIGPRAVDLMGIRFDNGLTWAFDAAATVPRLLAPGQRVLVVGHRTAFAHRHGASPPVAGQFTGQLDNGGERFVIMNAANTAAIRDFVYDDIAPWPAESDGAGPSLVLINPLTNPDHNLPANWRASRDSGNPGASDAFSYGAWKATFAPGQPDNSDNDRDGLTVFQEYVFNGVPGTNDSRSLPSGGLMTIGADQYQTLAAKVRYAADDLLLTPQSSANLTAWTGSEMVLVSRSRNLDSTETFVWRHIRPWRSDLRLFMRLLTTVP